MKRILKWFFVILGGLLGLALAGVAVVHFYIGHRLNVVHDVPSSSIVIPDDEASLAEGERLARIRGCNGGCHGEVAGGNVFFEMPDGSRVIAPDLGRRAQEYSAEDFERAIRHGVRPDGTSLIAIMPSAMFSNLSDPDVASIIAFLQQQRPSEERLPDAWLGPIVRVMLVYFSKVEGFDILAAEEIDHEAESLNPDSDDPKVRGEYLAMTSCPECHGSELQGSSDGSTPNLAIVAAYSLDNFSRLMRTGVPIGDRKLDLMAGMATSRFAYFTDTEVEDLHAFLQTLVSD